MKTKLMALPLLAGSTMFAGPRFYFGVGVDGYGQAPRYYVAPYVAPPPVYVAPVPVPVYYRPAYYYVARPPFVAPDVPYAGKSVQTIDVTPLSPGLVESRRSHQKNHPNAPLISFSYSREFAFIRGLNFLLFVIPGSEGSQMSTLKQQEANRMNAQKSTGPKTEAGKRRGALNALRHGLTAQVTRMSPRR